MILATFKAVLRTRNPKVAEQVAMERGLCFGFCIYDGMSYVGEPAELKKGGLLYITDPSRKNMTAIEVARQFKVAKPHIRYAAAVDDSCVVAWREKESLWVRVACNSISGDWIVMPYELLVNGERIPLPALVEV